MNILRLRLAASRQLMVDFMVNVGGKCTINGSYGQESRSG